MAITLQALQSDGTWSVRNAFVTENAKVVAGSMTADDLEAKARKLMSQWIATMPDGRQLRVHNSDNDPKPSSRSADVEIAASTHGFMRVVQNGNRFEVQTKRIRGEHKPGCITYWHTLAGFWDQAKALSFYQCHV